MLKYTDYDIVFQEIPDEVTLAINLSRCPHRCKGCHSPHLRQDIGEELDEAALCRLLQTYGNSITCICFMGGDADTDEVCRLAYYVLKNWKGSIKTAWYSGCNELKNKDSAVYFNFIKLGPYMETLGGLNKKTTNQRLYQIENGNFKDITVRMQK